MIEFYQEEGRWRWRVKTVLGAVLATGEPADTRSAAVRAFGDFRRVMEEALRD